MRCWNCRYGILEKGYYVRKGNIITPSCHACSIAYSEVSDKDRAELVPDEKIERGNETLLVLIHKDFM